MTRDSLYNELAKYYPYIDGKSEDDVQAEVKSLLEYISDFKDKCPEELSILDIGCGTGRHAEIIADNYGATVYAIDINNGMVRQARNRSAISEVIQADMHTLPFDNESKFDVIICLSNTLAYATSSVDRQIIFNEMDRVTNETGLVLIEFAPAADPDNIKNNGKTYTNILEYKENRLVITALQRTTIDGYSLSMITDYLIWDASVDPNTTQHFTDKHTNLTMATKEEIREELTRSGFSNIDVKEKVVSDTLFVAK